MRVVHGGKNRLTALLAGLCAAVVALTVVAAPASAAEDPPDSMAALGDSITRAFNACGLYVECPFRSWSTGGSPKVDSHYRRILSGNHDILFDNHNNAVSGATMSDLAGQARQAVNQSVGYVTILMGANDACAPAVDAMTPVDTFRQQLDDALAVLREGLPEADVFIASIPDIYQLWEVAKGEEEARAIWRLGGICQALLDDPLSEDPADAQRRQRVRERVVAYNHQLADACADYAGTCVYDGGAVFEYDFERKHISDWDYFHPSVAGQRVLAEITYPCDRVQLVRQASSQGADDDLIGHLGTLPDVPFDGPDAVHRAFETGA